MGTFKGTIKRNGRPKGSQNKIDAQIKASFELLVSDNLEQLKKDIASLVGKTLAEKAVKLGVSKVSFDRAGYLYHGRVKSLADGAREGGLKF